MQENVKSFLDKIQELKIEKSKVTIISSGEKAECSPLTFKQQKSLIGTIADGPSGTLRFNRILNDIISENTGRTDLLVTDKLPIILQIRNISIGGKYKDIDLIPVVAAAERLKFETKKVVTGGVDVYLEVPTLAQESKIIQAAVDSVKKDQDELGKSVGDVYTYEIVKYVKSVVFGEDTLNFQDIPIKDRFKIVNALPFSINKEIVEFIQDIKSKESDVLTVIVDGEEKLIEIDVTFFDT